MPFRSPIFRKLLLSAFVLIAMLVFVLDLYLTRYAARRETQAVSRRLAGEARILAGELDAVGRERLETWAKAAEGRARARITLIGRDGAVLADSRHDPETMENHARRPEVAEARRGRTGTAIRRSATLGQDLCYVAIPIEYEQAAAVLRIAVPITEVDSSVAELRARVLAVSAAAAAAVLAMAYWFSRSFTRRVQRLQRFAEMLPGGRVLETLAPDADDELGRLAAGLSEAAARMRELIDKLSVESGRREAILAGMIEGVLVVDSGMRVMFSNPSFARAAGTMAAAGSPASEVVRDPALADMMSRVLVTGESLKARMRLAGAQGRSYEVQVSPLGGRRGAIVLLHDITELDRLERVRKDFVANVSHELRTPLTAIRGYAETLLDGALEDPENNRKFVEIIRAHSIRLNNIASDLLTLSELEAGQAAGASERIPVRAAIEAALRTVEAEARVRGVTVRTRALEDAEVIGQRFRLEQALVNLLDNAIKFNRPGGEVAVEATRGNGDVRIAIADTGCGIAPEHIARIFERFYRVDTARSREVGGTGLGLSIVKHIVERMGGGVSVESVPGEGTTFILRFRETS